MRPVDAGLYAVRFESGSIQSRLGSLKQFLENGLIGGAVLVERLLIALLADGHVLVEGSPGLAKTRAVKLLSRGLHAPFARIQCTPDLMPADLTGTSIWRPGTGTFEFSPGPVFHSLVLVDEINRAPPKVQSALLEAMAESQVTAGGVTHPLPNPFMVVATQNPIEHEGTFPLPEAQLDRFMLKVEVSLPDAATERLILDLVEGEAAGGSSNAEPAPIAPAEIVEARRASMAVFLSPAVKDYIVRLVTAARRPGSLSGTRGQDRASRFTAWDLGAGGSSQGQGLSRWARPCGPAGCRGSRRRHPFAPDHLDVAGPCGRSPRAPSHQ